MIRIARNILVLFGFMVSGTALAGQDLSPYALQMAASMQRVVSGDPFQKAFPWPMETASNDWEAGFRSHLKAIEPVTAQTAALALNWTFYKAGKPIYVAQIVLMPTSSGPALMRLQKLWAQGEKAYPEWMVSIKADNPMNGQTYFCRGRKCYPRSNDAPCRNNAPASRLRMHPCSKNGFQSPIRRCKPKPYAV